MVRRRRTSGRADDRRRGHRRPGPSLPRGPGRDAVPPRAAGLGTGHRRCASAAADRLGPGAAGAAAVPPGRLRHGLPAAGHGWSGGRRRRHAAGHRAGRARHRGVARIHVVGTGRGPRAPRDGHPRRPGALPAAAPVAAAGEVVGERPADDVGGVTAEPGGRVGRPEPQRLPCLGGLRGLRGGLGGGQHADDRRATDRLGRAAAARGRGAHRGSRRQRGTGRGRLAGRPRGRQRSGTDQHPRTADVQWLLARRHRRPGRRRLVHHQRHRLPGPPGRTAPHRPGRRDHRGGRLHRLPARDRGRSAARTRSSGTPPSSGCRSPTAAPTVSNWRRPWSRSPARTRPRTT